MRLRTWQPLKKGWLWCPGVWPWSPVWNQSWAAPLPEQEGSKTVNIWQAKFTLCLETDWKLRRVFSGCCTTVFFVKIETPSALSGRMEKKVSLQSKSLFTERREVFIVPLRVLSSFANFLHECKWEVVQSITGFQPAGRYNRPDVNQTWGTGNSSLRGSF